MRTNEYMSVCIFDKCALDNGTLGFGIDVFGQKAVDTCRALDLGVLNILPKTDMLKKSSQSSFQVYYIGISIPRITSREDKSCQCGYLFSPTPSPSVSLTFSVSLSFSRI